MVNKHLITVYKKQEQIDPTRTIALRRVFEKQMDRRFNSVTREIKKAVVSNDVFGLKMAIQANTPASGAFNFPTSQGKVEAFMKWLREMMNEEILQVGKYHQLGTPINNAWTDLYVQDSYKRGIIRGRQELRKAGFSTPTLEASGGINQAFNQPFHMDRVGVLYSRVFKDLEGITSAMDTAISRLLSEGMIHGDNPKLLARKMLAVIEGGGNDLGITDSLGRFIPGKRRAQMLARTEVIRAHHLATIQEYKNWGVAGVNVKAEFSTSGDGNVCERCSSLQGKIYTLDEIEGLLPLHPNCRCLALPHKEDEKTKKEKVVKQESIDNQPDNLVTPDLDIGDKTYYQVYDYLDKHPNITVSKGSNSITDWGHSRYLYVNDKTSSMNINSGLGYKVRVSDHSVTNLDRVFNEFHLRSHMTKTDIFDKLKELEYMVNPELFLKVPKKVSTVKRLEVPNLLESDIVKSTRVTKKGNTLYTVDRTYINDMFDIVDPSTGKVILSNLSP